MGKVIVITGSVGTGKTTVSKILAEELGCEHIDLGEVAVKKKFILSFNDRRISFIADLPRLTEFVTGLVEKTEGYVIVDGHYAPAVVPLRLVSIAVVLRCDPDQLRGRLSRLTAMEGKIAENVEAEIIDLCLYDAIKAYGTEKVLEIDTTDKKPEKVVEEILAVLRGEKKASVGKVDWLAKLEKEDRLREFLRY